MENVEKKCGTCFFWREHTGGIVGDCMFPLDIVAVPPWAARDMALTMGNGGWARYHEAGTDCRVWEERDGQ